MNSHIINQINDKCIDECESLHEEGIKEFGTNWLQMNEYAKSIILKNKLTTDSGAIEPRIKHLVLKLLLLPKTIEKVRNKQNKNG